MGGHKRLRRDRALADALAMGKRTPDQVAQALGVSEQRVRDHLLGKSREAKG